MTTVMVHGHARDPITFDDVQRFPDDGFRYELIGGTLLVSPPPVTDHQRIVRELLVVLVEQLAPELEVLPAPYAWYVDQHTFFEPDVLVLRTHEVGPRRLEVPPVLAIEVLSPSNRAVDLGLKRMAYAEAGLRSYWVVDPDGGPSLTTFRRDDRELVEIAHAAGDERFETDDPFRVSLVPASLLP